MSEVVPDDPVDSIGSTARLTAELIGEVNLTNLNFLSDAQIRERLGATSASPEQLEEALDINAAARSRALKIGFLLLSCLALLAIFPCSWLPNYRPGQVPAQGMPRK